MKYLIYYFSATGNTKHAIDRIAESLEKNGHEIKTVSINNETNYSDLAECDRLIFAVPVLAWSAPDFVQKFMHTLPKTNKEIRTAILCCDGGNGFQAPLQAKRILDRRGYSVFLTGMISYPENWKQCAMTMPKEKRAECVDQGDVALTHYIENLLSGKSTYHTISMKAHILSWIAGQGFRLFGRRFLGKLHIADDDCNSCGLCVKTCPVDAIHFSGKAKNAKPYWNLQCESCNRCLNICPKNAINSSTARAFTLILAILLFCVPGIIAYASYLKPHILAIAPGFGSILNGICIIIILLLGHWFALFPFDAFVLKPLQKSKLFRKWFTKTFTKQTAQYVMDGYVPKK